MGERASGGESGQLPFRWGSVSTLGKIRSENQDACLTDADLGLFLVADGMGGEKAGEIASKVVVSVLPGMVHARLKTTESLDEKSVLLDLRDTIAELSKLLRGKGSESSGLTGMGATLVMALLRERKAHIAHIGDSRAYLFRNNEHKRLTQDHSVIDILLRNGEIKPEDVEDHPDRGRLARYLGMPDDAYPDVVAVNLQEGDRLLLCSDGLTGMVDDPSIASLLREHSEPKDACHALVQAANAAGGHDNITIVIVDWTGEKKGPV